jgi:hypothetical protein
MPDGNPGRKEVPALSTGTQEIANDECRGGSAVPRHLDADETLRSHISQELPLS